MPRLLRDVAGLPPEVEDVFEEFRTCEMSTLARDGTPITWPTLPFWYSDEKRFTITTSIGLAQKALNVRRDPRVSLLFSNPTASGLENPPAVMVQGDAEAPDEIETSVAGFEEDVPEEVAAEEVEQETAQERVETPAVGSRRAGVLVLGAGLVLFYVMRP